MQKKRWSEEDKMNCRKKNVRMDVEDKRDKKVNIHPVLHLLWSWLYGHVMFSPDSFTIMDYIHLYIKTLGALIN